jgi:hypothetical protein
MHKTCMTPVAKWQGVWLRKPMPKHCNILLITDTCCSRESGTYQRKAVPTLATHLPAVRSAAVAVHGCRHGDLGRSLGSE